MAFNRAAHTHLVFAARPWAERRFIYIDDEKQDFEALLTELRAHGAISGDA